MPLTLCMPHHQNIGTSRDLLTVNIVPDQSQGPAALTSPVQGACSGHWPHRPVYRTCFSSPALCLGDGKAPLSRCDQKPGSHPSVLLLPQQLFLTSSNSHRLPDVLSEWVSSLPPQDSFPPSSISPLAYPSSFLSDPVSIWPLSAPNSSPCCSWRNLFHNKSDHTMVLLNTHKWFPNVLR